MKLVFKGLLAVASVATLGAALLVGASLANPQGNITTFVNRKEAKQQTDFSTETIKRRVYIVNNDNYWGSNWTEANMATLYVHAWSLKDDSNKTTAPVATTLLMDDVQINSVNRNLYYADVEFKGAAHEIGVIVSINDQLLVKTIDVSLPALNSALGDVVYLNNGLTDGNRNASVGSIGTFSEGNAAYFLSNYNTCSDAYTNGYNAYPQIVKDFYNITAVYGETPVKDYAYEDYVAAGKNYDAPELERTDAATTISAKLAAMKSMYDSDGWTVSGNAVPFNFQNEPYDVEEVDGSWNIKYEVDQDSYANMYSWIGEKAGAKGISFDLINNKNKEVKMSIGFGTGDPFVSHLQNKRCDWYGDGRACFSIGGNGWRAITVYFEDEATVDGCLFFLDSIWGEDGTRTGDVTIKNAVYLF